MGELWAGCSLLIKICLPLLRTNFSQILPIIIPIMVLQETLITQLSTVVDRREDLATLFLRDLCLLLSAPMAVARFEFRARTVAFGD